MTTIVTRYDFNKNRRKYINLADKETVIIIPSKLAGLDEGFVLMSWVEYRKLRRLGE